MTRTLSLILLCLGAVPAGAQDTCPWAGGEYAFRDHGIYGDFTVNADCTELVWSRLTDAPETSALERTGQGWAGELQRARFELLNNGRNLRITGLGGAMRQTKAERTN